MNLAALPHRVLARVRMLIDCVVYPLGLALSALSLLWLQNRIDSPAVLEVTIVIAAAFAGVSALVGAWFLPSLLRSLRLRAISPSEYARAKSGRLFSARDIRQMLNHPDPRARLFGVQLANKVAPDLLSATTISEGCPAGDLPSWPTHGRGAEQTLPEATDEKPFRLRHDDFAAVGVTPPPRQRGLPSRRGAMRSRRSDAKIWCFAMIARTPTAERLEDIGRGLEDRSAAVRRATASLLARLGAAAVPTAAKYLSSDRQEVVEAAIRALAASGRAGWKSSSGGI